MSVSVEETEYGIIVRTVQPGTYKYPSRFCMPNAHEWGNPPRAGHGLWSYARGWRVPIDDSHYYRFGLDVVPLTGEAAKEYQDRQAARFAKATRRTEEIADAILAGRESAKDLSNDQPDLVNIQDYIAQVALGDIAAQPNQEHLGRADVGVILVRRLWARELQALAEGRPLTQWRRPDSFWTDVTERNREEAGVK